MSIAPAGIASAEAFGTALLAVGPPPVVPVQTVQTTAVPGWYAVGPKILPTGIPSASAVGTPTVAYRQVIAPAGIASAEAFGTPSLPRGPVYVTAAGIPSAEAFGAPSVIPGTAHVTATGIASAEAFGTPAITVGPVTVAPAGIASAEAFGTAAVAVLAPFKSFTEFNTPRTNQLLPTGVDFAGVWLTMIGAGGGGGSGRRAANTNAGGSGGGGGAYLPRTWIPKSALGSDFSVTVGTTGGAGGAGQATNNTNGNPGTAGAATVFSSGSTVISAGGGGAGVAGANVNNTGGAGGTVTGATGSPGTAGGGSSIAGAATAGTNGSAVNSGGGGGGGGGGITAGGAGQVGGKGGDVNGQAGGAAAAPGVNGLPGSALITGLPVAGSGGGGSYGTNVAGLTGGDGRGYGAGGAGGSANISAGGAGGNGGPGFILVEFALLAEENTPRTNQPVPATATGVWAGPLIGAGGAGGSSSAGGASGGAGGGRIDKVFVPRLGITPLPVTFDAAGVGAGVAAASANWLHTINGNAVVVSATAQNSSATPTVTAQVGSTPMVEIGRLNGYYGASGFFNTIVMFGLLNPPTGSQTITVNSPGSVSITAESTSYNNVFGFGTLASNLGNSTAPSLSAVPSATGQMVVQASGGWTQVFSAYNQTSRYLKQYAASVNTVFQMGDAPGASSVSFTVTGSPALGWGALAVPLSPTPSLGANYSTVIGAGGATAQAAGGASTFASGSVSLSAGGGGGGVSSGAGPGAGGSGPGGVCSATGGIAVTSYPGSVGGGYNTAGAGNANDAGAGGGGGYWTIAGAGGSSKTVAGGGGGTAGSPTGKKPADAAAGSGGAGGGGAYSGSTGGAGGLYGGGGGGGGGAGGIFGAGANGYGMLEFTDIAPVLFDSVGAGKVVAVFTGLTWTEVIAAGANAVIVGIGLQAVAPITVVVTCGGVAMTQLAAINPYYVNAGYNDSVYMFGLLASQCPGGVLPTGTVTFAVTVTGGAGSPAFAANSMSYFNVASFGTPVVNDYNSGSSTNPLQLVPLAPNRRVAQFISGFTSNFSAYTQTQRWLNNYNPGLSALMGDAPGSNAIVNLGATCSAQPWGAISVPLIPL